jgi:GNAT superfamily N-acetyltransferase
LWTEQLHSYGFIDASIPELGMGVGREHRRRGIGRALLSALLDRASADGYAAISLSVSPVNPAGALRVARLRARWRQRHLMDAAAGALRSAFLSAW